MSFFNRIYVKTFKFITFLNIIHHESWLNQIKFLSLQHIINLKTIRLCFGLLLFLFLLFHS